MIVRTEYSYRQVFGPIPEVVARLPPWGGIIADDGTWGHVPFAKEAKKQGKKAVLGWRTTHANRPLTVVPRSPAGLRALYAMVAEGFSLARARDEDVALVVPGHPGADLGPRALSAFIPGVVRPALGLSVATSDNLFPAPGDRQAWNLMLGRLARQRPGPAHIMAIDELLGEGATSGQLQGLQGLIGECDTPLPSATNIKFPVADAQAELTALAGAELRRRKLKKVYRERLDYELKLIGEKAFADYFLVIADMMAYAKQHMLVGPARGSSCGSLLCWLMRITEVDPLKHGLIFERFIDVNRADLPDIDIDFPDTKRELVIQYLANKYGAANVAHIGTVIRYKPKSALIDVAKEGAVPLWELDKLKGVMIERSSGDSRASSCLMDSFTRMDVGRDLLRRYPILEIACRLEGHARSAGIHAAGIIVCNEPVSHFCGVKEGISQLDKKMAEAINILKIDALGLRTLSVIEECCVMVGKPFDAMYDLPLEDQEVFKTFNAHRFSGIFQFEGIALQSVAKQVVITCFDDVAALTALARPGPLSSGETTRWVKGKRGTPEPPLHPALSPFVEATFNTILYQEQVMQIVRTIGKLSWADTSLVRKVMSDRKGNEAFAVFGKKFCDGAVEGGMDIQDAERIWKAVNTFGSWAFNRSHAVAYGLVSYWTGWLKTHHPVEFAVANLRHSKDDDSALVMLREVMREGTIEFTPVDADKSTERWEYDSGRLLGPLTGLVGCGAKTAKEICLRRNNGAKLTPRQKKLLSGVSKFADYNPCRKMWGRFYDNPQSLSPNVERIFEASEVQTQSSVSYVVIGRLVKKNLRDLNEEKYLTRRNGKRTPEALANMLLFHLEDDSGRLLCMIKGEKYAALGKRIVEEAAVGQWFAVRGRVPMDFKMMEIDKVKWLEGGKDG